MAAKTKAELIEEIQVLTAEINKLKVCLNETREMYENKCNDVEKVMPITFSERLAFLVNPKKFI